MQDNAQTVCALLVNTHYSLYSYRFPYFSIIIQSTNLRDVHHERLFKVVGPIMAAFFISSNSSIKNEIMKK